MPLIGNGHTHVDEVHFFGSDGLGNAPNAFPKVQKTKTMHFFGKICFPKVLPTDFDAYVKGKHAATALCELFTQHADACLVCIGPLTNMALALKLDPAFARMPARMVLLGGNVYGLIGP